MTIKKIISNNAIYYLYNESNEYELYVYVTISSTGKVGQEVLGRLYKSLFGNWYVKTKEFKKKVSGKEYGLVVLLMKTCNMTRSEASMIVFDFLKEQSIV